MKFLNSSGPPHEEIFSSTNTSFGTENDFSCANTSSSSSSSSNCTTVPEKFSWYVFFVREANYPADTLALFALIFNSAVVATLWRSRRESKSKSKSFVQLTALAVVDFCFCFPYAATLFWRLCIDAGVSQFEDAIDQTR